MMTKTLNLKAKSSKLRLLLVVYLLLPCLSPILSEAEVIEWVQRRIIDVYSVINSTHHRTCGDKNTYLVHEEQCVSDQELSTGKLHDVILSAVN